jgi:hypothetical protein
LSVSFPFERFGLTNKYEEMIPSMTEFGFVHDRYFLNIFAGTPWPGIMKSKAHVEDMAKSAGLTRSHYRRQLNRRYDAFKELQDELNNVLELQAAAQGGLS